MRFPDFNDDWKKTTLGEIGRYVRGLTYTTDDVQESGYIVVRANNITEGRAINFDAELVYVGASPSSQQILQNNDIAISMANGSSRLVGKASYYDGYSYGTCTVGAFCGIFRSSDIITRWLFQTPIYNRYIYQSIQGGDGAIANLKGEDILRQIYFLPSLAEQKKIADFLSLIDERIHSLSETIKELKTQKAGLLNQLFSQKLRFPDFDDEWRVTTLGEIGETYTGLSGKSSENFGKGSPYITYKMVYDGVKINLCNTEYVYVSESEKQNQVRLGDILFTTSSETPEETGLCSVLLSSSDELYLNSFCFGYRLNEESLATSIFLGYALRSPIYRIKLSTLAQGSTRYNISKSEVMRMPISLPSLEEQKKIADFLSLVDERIEVEEQLLKKYEEQKKYLLRNMFV